MKITKNKLVKTLLFTVCLSALAVLGKPSIVSASTCPNTSYTFNAGTGQAIKALNLTSVKTVEKQVQVSASTCPNTNYTSNVGAEQAIKALNLTSVKTVENQAQVSASTCPNTNYTSNAGAKQAIKAPNLTSVKTVEKQVQVMVNNERAKVGLSPLALNLQLSTMARSKSQDMIDKGYFSHQSPTYGSPFDMMKSFGFTYMSAGENIAEGQPTATEVMNSWMNSAGHKANILNKSYSEIGVGLAKKSDGTCYWTQDFIGK